MEMAFPSMVSMPFADVHKKSDFVAKVAKAFKKSSRKNHSLVQNNSLQLVAWIVSGESWLKREYRKNLPSLSLSLGYGNKVLLQIGLEKVLGLGVLGKD